MTSPKITNFRSNGQDCNLVLTNEDGENELVFGELVEKESWVGMRSLGEVKAFPIGTAIAFSAKEFSDVTWTFFLYGENLVTKIHAHGVASGIISDTTEKA